MQGALHNSARQGEFCQVLACASCCELVSRLCLCISGSFGKFDVYAMRAGQDGTGKAQESAMTSVT